MLIWTSTEEEDDSDYNQTDYRDQFDAGKPEFCFAEERDGDDVKKQDCDEDDCNPDSGIDVFVLL